MIKLSSQVLIFVLLCGSANYLAAQKAFTFTKSFDKKLKKYDLEYYQPTDIWLHPVPYQDEYDEYDMVLYSEDQDVEVRYLFRDSSSPLALSSMPHFEFYRSILDFASNEEEDNQIAIQDMLPETALELYNADWCLTAEFTPKASVSNMPKGRILGIYKEGSGLIFCVIFFDGDLPSYFELPIKFIN